MMYNNNNNNSNSNSNDDDDDDDDDCMLLNDNYVDNDDIKHEDVSNYANFINNNTIFNSSPFEISHMKNIFSNLPLLGASNFSSFNIPSNLSNQELAQSNNPLSQPIKRKQQNHQIEESIQELDQLKRVRVISSPGELRLRKDIQEFLKNQNNSHAKVIFENASEPGSILIKFVDSNSDYSPSLYLVMVEKYYPHQCPIVKSLQENYQCKSILESGEVIHPAICDQWTAICSINTVIDVLNDIRINNYSSHNQSILNQSVLILDIQSNNYENEFYSNYNEIENEVDIEMR